MDETNNPLDVEFDFEGTPTTVRGYLLSLLLTLWDEGESFSGKRPFGNSGWEYDLYKPLIAAGFIPGRLDDDGHVDDVDATEAHAFVRSLIEGLTASPSARDSA